MGAWVFCFGVYSLTIRSGGQKDSLYTIGKCTAEILTLKEDIFLGKLNLNFTTTKFSVDKLERMYDFTSSFDVSGAKRETKTNFLGFTATRGFTLRTVIGGEITGKVNKDEEVGRIGRKLCLDQGFSF